MRLVEFVRQARAKFAGSSAICIGNSGGDLDSIVCCFAYAWLQGLRNGIEVTPVMSFPRDELVLRKDVELVLKEAGIGPADLLFVDDLQKGKKYALHLVDHNDVDGPEEGEVVSIIDHHADIGRHMDAKPRVVEKSGSCISLVLRELLGDYCGKLTTEERCFLSGPILADTRGLTARVEDVDRWAVEALSLNQIVSVAAYTKELQSAKADVSGLTARDLLRKDYKQWTVDEKHVLGISSVMGKVKSVTDSMPLWAAERNLSTLLAMGAYEDDNGMFCRELAVYGEFPEPSQLASLCLEELSASSNVTVYRQQAVECSRKQVAPLVLEILKKC